MKEYRVCFTKTVYGYIKVSANSKKDALAMAETGEYDEHDNKSEYELGEVLNDE